MLDLNCSVRGNADLFYCKSRNLSQNKKARITISPDSFRRTSVYQQGPQVAEVGPDSRPMARKLVTFLNFCAIQTKETLV